MYTNINFNSDNQGNFIWKTNDHPFKILQLTDLHLGFGWLSKRKDRLAMEAIGELILKTSPDLIMLTGDSIFPYIPKAGTRDNIKQAKGLVDFMDSFEIPYAYMFGNHDIEMGSKGNKNQIASLIKKGRYSIFNEGDPDITGLGNYSIRLLDESENLKMELIILDSNMYRDGWFYSGFDCIHEDQVEWCMNKLNQLEIAYEKPSALAFYHMPLAEFKEAYEKMKLGDQSVHYNFGSIGEPDEYFGISKYDCSFFNQAVANGVIKGMFCGHDHLNTLSLTYKGIMMTYGMSIDYLGYSKIEKKYIQRGGTLITIENDGNFEVKPIPLTKVVSQFVRGIK